MAYIDCDKCSHGSVCAYRHQYDDHIVTCSHWKPADDVVEVVRCKDCKHWRHETDGMIDHYECAVFCGCYGEGYLTGADDFCSYGERKEK